MENESTQGHVSKSTTGTQKINLALIASGSGTDANSIMEAWEARMYSGDKPAPADQHQKRGRLSGKGGAPGIARPGAGLQRMQDLDRFNSALCNMLKPDPNGFDFSGGLHH